MKVKSSSSVGIIGGADGPTSVFVAGSHTPEEVVAYADEKYHLIEVTKTGRKYVEQRKRFKESLVSKHKTEL